MIQIQGQYTPDDYRNAQKLHVQTRPGALSGVWAYFVIVGVLLVLSIVLSQVSTGTVPWLGLLIPFAPIVAMGFSLATQGPRQIARVFQQQKELSAPIEIELSEDGFALTTLYGHIRIPWKDFVKWKQDQQLILLYRSDASYHILPIRYLAGGDQLEYIHGLLAQNAVQDARKIPRRNRAWRWVVYGLLAVAICILVLILFQSP